MQQNQAVVFMSDGGDNVRNLLLSLRSTAEHVLDWFHVAMRFTVLGQLTKGLPEGLKIVEDVGGRLERVKHSLWHGHLSEGRAALHNLENDLDTELFEAKAKLPRSKNCFER